jgi:cytochrome c-type biogenesis protein CcmF
LNLVADFVGYEMTIAERRKKGSGLRRSLRWYGSRVVHIGVVLMFVGIAGSGGYGLEEHRALKPGQAFTLGKFKIVYEGLKADHGPNFTAVTANVPVYKAQDSDDTKAAADTSVTKDGKLIAELKPSKAAYNASGKAVSEVDIRRTLAGDLYLALTEFDSSTKLINLRILIKPLINWIWIGSIVMILGTVFVLISYYKQKVIVSRD